MEWWNQTQRYKRFPKKMTESTYSHVHVRWLKASLVDIVESKGLSGVGAVLINFHSHPAASWRVWLSLRLLSPRRHDLWQGEGHGTCDQSGAAVRGQGVNRWLFGLQVEFIYQKKLLVGEELKSSLDLNDRTSFLPPVWRFFTLKREQDHR